MEHSVEAQVIDSRHLKLKKPIQIPAGSEIIITIESAESLAEGKAWYTLSAQGLQAAYGENEPDYPLERIKISNPDFQP